MGGGSKAVSRVGGRRGGARVSIARVARGGGGAVVGVVGVGGGSEAVSRVEGRRGAARGVLRERWSRARGARGGPVRYVARERGFFREIVGRPRPPRPGNRMHLRLDPFQQQWDGAIHPRTIRFDPARHKKCRTTSYSACNPPSLWAFETGPVIELSRPPSCPVLPQKKKKTQAALFVDL